MIFAEASNAFTGQWVYACAAIIGLFIAVGSYFATRREVDALAVRLTKTEEVLDTIRAEMKSDKEELIAIGEKRSTVLHNRINPLVENTAALKASQEAFVAAFNNFTEMMKAMNNNRRHP